MSSSSTSTIHNSLANWIDRYELSGVMFSIYADSPSFLIDVQK